MVPPRLLRRGTREELPKLSVCVLTYNRKEVLAQQLVSLRPQTLPGHEIIAVDNGSADGTSEMLRERFPWVKVIRLEENLGCVARTHGVAAACAELAVTLDDDVLLASSQKLGRAVPRFHV